MPSTHDERPEPSFWDEYVAELWPNPFRRTSERDRVSGAAVLAAVVTAVIVDIAFDYTPLHSLHGFAQIVALLAICIPVYSFLLVLFRRIDRRRCERQQEQSSA